MPTLDSRNTGKLNQLARLVPEGLVVDAAWLSNHGYSTALRSKYVSAGWLEQPARRVYRRPRGRLVWQQVVVSLQSLLQHPLVVGGRSAVEVQGYGHYLAQEATEVHLYGPGRPPGWLKVLPLDTRFVYHNSSPLFGDEWAGRRPPPLDPASEVRSETDLDWFGEAGFSVLRWGQWDWPLLVSTPERAVLELLDELPGRESFHQVDALMDGLVGLSPRRLHRLLVACRSVKVKRLFFFFADRHAHAWLEKLDREAIDLGAGKRMLVEGGRLDSTYQITVPKDLYGLQ